MASKAGALAVGIGYALGGGVLIGGVGIVIGITLAPGHGPEVVSHSVIGFLAGALIGAILGVIVFVAGSKVPVAGQTADLQSDETTSRPDGPDPYLTIRPPSLGSLARFIGRGIAVLVGLGIGLYGLSFYMLRCFSTCPTDPAENALSHILPLTIMTLAAAVVTAAVTTGTRAATTGSWINTGLGILLMGGGIAGLVVVPALRFSGERTGIVTFGIIAIAVGVGLVLFGKWVRGRSVRER